MNLVPLQLGCECRMMRPEPGDRDVNCTGKNALARTPVVGDLSQAAIEAAAKQRYQAFFGYAQNLFIGDSAENSSIQEHLDRGRPAMAEKELMAHVARIKRSWAIDNSIQISGLDT